MKIKLPKNNLIAVLVLFVGIFVGCSGEEESQPSMAGEFRMFKNQTDQLSANALQAMYKNNGETLDFYGTFDDERNPNLPTTLTYRAVSADTLVNMVLDPQTRRVSSVFFSINGQKLPQVMKFHYREVASMVNVSIYNCDWGTQAYEELFSVNVVVDPALFAQGRFAQSGADAFFNHLNTISQSLLIGVVVVEIVAPIVVAVGTALSPVLLPVLTAGGAFLGASLVIDLIVNNQAQAAPLDTPYPEDVAVQNPAPDGLDEAVETPDCSEISIEFDASMDGEGTIMMFGAGGGTAPYTYLLGGQNNFTNVGVYANHPNGTYVLAVKDANGCISAKAMSLSRPCDLVVSATSSGTTATAVVQGGTPPFIFLWSNGATTSTISNLADGTYTVSVTDANACGATGSTTVSNGVNHFLTGTWVVTADRYDGDEWSPAGVWIDFFHSCGLVSVKEKTVGTATFTHNSYSLNRSLEWIDFGVNENCISNGQTADNGSVVYWGGFDPQPVNTGGEQRYFTVNPRVQDETEEWTPEHAYFQVIDQNTIVYRELEYDNVYFNIKMVRE